jgi:predicted short-subunit dehydrogenase-like oxidoreductase (DUF2520 family)
MSRTLNIVGAGHVGRTLGRLFTRTGTLEVRGVLNRSLASAREAVGFIGAGTAVGEAGQLPDADITLVTTGDAAIGEATRALVAAGRVARGACVAHCSGVLSSEVLRDARRAGAHIASLHPMMTFPDPARAAERFAGTYCGVEGDPLALDVLLPAFIAIGAVPFAIDPERKAAYHAGAVLACGSLVTLIEAGLRCFAAAGVERDVALRALAPLVEATIAGVLRDGPASALTGPIARGDDAGVEQHLRALAPLDPTLAPIYRSIGLLALELAKQAGRGDAAGRARIRARLEAE